MKKLRSYLNLLFLIGVLFAFVTYTGCNDDDENSVESQLIGLWNITDATVDASIGGQSLKDYFMMVLQMSDLEAEGLAGFVDATLASTFTGTIEIKDNHTYVTNFAGEIDDGTWSLNSAGDKITLDAGTADEMVITIVSLTSNMLVASTDMIEMIDIDDDELTPDIPISVSVQMTLSK